MASLSAGVMNLGSVGAHVDVRDRLFDFWHVAGDALASSAPRRVVSVRFDGRRVGTVFSVGPVTGGANLLHRLDQHCIVLSTVGIVAAETRDAARVHQALYEIGALHTVFVCCPIGEMSERQLAQFVILQLPEIR
jgi:hypothetical protein